MFFSGAFFNLFCSRCRILTTLQNIINGTHHLGVHLYFLTKVTGLAANSTLQIWNEKYTLYCHFSCALLLLTFE
jgi:hypothetical protein